MLKIASTTMSTTLGRTSSSLEISEHQVAGTFLSSIEINHWTPEEATALLHALVASFSVILVSELGDKTFIITAIMAMKNSRSLVFFSSAMALLLMTTLSVGLGVAVTVIPKVYTHIASIVLFVCFGFKMLKEAYDMKGDEGEESEFEEVKRTIESQERSKAQPDSKEPAVFFAPVASAGGQLGQPGTGTGGASKEQPHLAWSGPGAETERETEVTKKIPEEEETNWVTRRMMRLSDWFTAAPVVIKVFVMVFVAEWGDRSQISTVILAAREDVVGVFVGSFGGHVLCTGLAVVGGRFAAEMISVRTMTLMGGLIFLFFAVMAILTGPEL